MKIIEFFKNETVLFFVMGVLIFILTELIKIPYKKFLTSKITEEKYRKLANTVILLLPFILASIMLCVYWYKTYQAFDVVQVIKLATLPVTIYAFLEQVTSGRIKNPYNSEDGEQVINAIESIKDNAKKSDKTEANKETDKLISDFLSDIVKK